MDEDLGIRKGVSLNQKKESQVLLLSMHRPYREVEKVYEPLRGFRVSKNTVQRRVQAVGEEVKVSQPEVQVREGVGKNKQLEGSLLKSSVGSNFKISDELTPKNGTHPILPST